MADNITIIKKETYRSKPAVNITADMVRVVLTMPAWKWREIKKAIKIEEKQ